MTFLTFRGRAIPSRLAALLLGFALAASVQAASVLERGLQLWQAGQFAQAVAVWWPLAERGEPEAQLFLGFAYKTGRGVKANPLLASRWYRAAAEGGMPEAQMEMGLRYELGIGVKTDHEEAARWYGHATGGEYCPADLPAGGRLGEK